MQGEKFTRANEQIESLIHAIVATDVSSTKGKKKRVETEQEKADRVAAECSVVLRGARAIMINDSVGSIWNIYRAIYMLKSSLAEPDFVEAESIVLAWIKLKELHFVERRMVELR